LTTGRGYSFGIAADKEFKTATDFRAVFSYRALGRFTGIGYKEWLSVYEY
jgi:hypothetical protein